MKVVVVEMMRPLNKDRTCKRGDWAVVGWVDEC